MTAKRLEKPPQCEIQAELFIEQLREATKSGYSESLNNQLHMICLYTPCALSHFFNKLEALQPDSEFLTLTNFICKTGLGATTKQFPPLF